MLTLPGRALVPERVEGREAKQAPGTVEGRGMPSRGRMLMTTNLGKFSSGLNFLLLQ